MVNDNDESIGNKEHERNAENTAEHSMILEEQLQPACQPARARLSSSAESRSAYIPWRHPSLRYDRGVPGLASAIAGRRGTIRFDKRFSAALWPCEARAELSYQD